jgi:hypothetical protein
MTIEDEQMRESGHQHSTAAAFVVREVVAFRTAVQSVPITPDVSAASIREQLASYTFDRAVQLDGHARRRRDDAAVDVPRHTSSAFRVVRGCCRSAWRSLRKPATSCSGGRGSRVRRQSSQLSREEILGGQEGISVITAPACESIGRGGS